MSSPRDRALACLAVARSTMHAGEREAAIGRARSICERHGLDFYKLEERAFTARTGGASCGPTPGNSYKPRTEAAKGVAEAMRKFAEGMRAAEKEARARADETAADARRRNFDEECARAKERDLKHELRRKARAAADCLWRFQVAVYEHEDAWLVFHNGRGWRSSDEELIAAEAELTRRTAA